MHTMHGFHFPADYDLLPVDWGSLATNGKYDP